MDLGSPGMMIKQVELDHLGWMDQRDEMADDSVAHSVKKYHPTFSGPCIYFLGVLTKKLRS